MLEETSIRPARLEDAAALCRIYNHYIAHTSTTFEEQALTEEALKVRIETVQSKTLPWLVTVSEERTLGYAYAAPWRERSAYRNSVEVSVYLSHDTQIKGLGSALYARLFEELVLLNVHTALAVIALPNAASVALHEKFGMTKVAHLSEVGRKFDQWIDVGYWQRVF